MKHRVRRSPEQILREQLLSIGATLRQTREAKGYSLEFLAEQLLIRKMLLEAIETAQLEELPEPIYIRGLIRRYGDRLGLDGEVLASQFFTQPALSRSNHSWKSSPAAQLKPLHLYAAYVFLIVASVNGLSYFLRSTAPEPTATPILDPAAVEQLLPQRERQTARTRPQAAPEPTAEVNKPIVVDMQLTQASWVRIVADGNTAFEGMLNQGDSRSWAADQSLTVRAGNAGGVLVSYNKGNAERMGEPGTVAERTFRSSQVSLIN